jgi:hypothetical protein
MNKQALVSAESCENALYLLRKEDILYDENNVTITEMPHSETLNSEIIYNRTYYE